MDAQKKVKAKIERCKQKLTEGKEIILEQQKLLRIADREEDEWEVVKCYLSDDLAFDSDDEKQLSRARREAAANRKKREENKQKDKKKQFPNAPLPEKVSKSLAKHTNDTVTTVQTGIGKFRRKLRTFQFARD